MTPSGDFPGPSGGAEAVFRAVTVGLLGPVPAEIGQIAINELNKIKILFNSEEGNPGFVLWEPLRPFPRPRLHQLGRIQVLDRIDLQKVGFLGQIVKERAER